MDYGVSRGCETFKRNKLEENDNITVSEVTLSAFVITFRFFKACRYSSVKGCVDPTKRINEFCCCSHYTILDSFVEKVRFLKFKSIHK